MCTRPRLLPPTSGSPRCKPPAHAARARVPARARTAPRRPVARPRCACLLRRLSTIGLLVLPALGWVAFNILQPAFNQLNRQNEIREEAKSSQSAPSRGSSKKKRGLAGAVGLGAALSMFAAQQAEAATELHQLAASDNRWVAPRPPPAAARDAAPSACAGCMHDAGRVGSMLAARAGSGGCCLTRRMYVHTTPATLLARCVHIRSALR
jgi:hypothetical protein